MPGCHAAEDQRPGRHTVKGPAAATPGRLPGSHAAPGALPDSHATTLLARHQGDQRSDRVEPGTDLRRPDVAAQAQTMPATRRGRGRRSAPSRAAPHLPRWSRAMVPSPAAQPPSATLQARLSRLYTARSAQQYRGFLSGLTTTPRAEPPGAHESQSRARAVCCRPRPSCALERRSCTRPPRTPSGSS